MNPTPYLNTPISSQEGSHIFYNTPIVTPTPTRNPTKLSGRVIWPNDSVLNSPELSIALNKRLFPSGAILSTHNLELDSTGLFEIEFPFNPEVSHLDIVFRYTDEEGFPQSVNPGELICNPYACDDLEPHQCYDDLLIRIPTQ